MHRTCSLPVLPKNIENWVLVLRAFSDTTLTTSQHKDHSFADPSLDSTSNLHPIKATFPTPLSVTVLSTHLLFAKDDRFVEITPQQHKKMTTCPSSVESSHISFLSLISYHCKI